MSDPNRIPKYCRHKPTNQAYVRLGADFVYLGGYDSPHSRAAYNRVIAEWLAAGRVRSRPQDPRGLSVNEVVLAYWRHAETYYAAADGTPGREMENIKLAVRPLKELYGLHPAPAFGPLGLKAVRQAMIDAGLCRGVVNQRVGCIKRLFKWAASEELVPAQVFHALQAVDGLRRGRTTARETVPVKPVPDGHVDAVLRFLPPTLRAMVELQRLTGMRSGELCILRSGDVDTSGEVWHYRPSRHKTANRGHDRVVRLGPRARDVLRPFLLPDLQSFVFSPARARDERDGIKRLSRKSRVQPSQWCRKKLAPKRCAGPRYDTRSYHRALSYAIVLAHRAGALPDGVSWHPHQLRHSFATRVRRQHGLDAARALLGHRTLAQADEYAELDGALATNVIAQLG
jgi:integrase